jgi:AbrB family looped-hinge helix DNA binding protein
MSERVVIDKVGRIVIPKPLRMKLGLSAGDTVMVEADGGELVIRQEAKENGLIRRGKRLFRPRDPKAGALDLEDVNRIIDAMRDVQTRRALEEPDLVKAPRRPRARKPAR